MARKNDLANYKGIYYNDKTEKKPQHEFGAHFGYQDMCKRLEKLLSTLSPDRRGYSNDLDTSKKKPTLQQSESQLNKTEKTESTTISNAASSQVVNSNAKIKAAEVKKISYKINPVRNQSNTIKAQSIRDKQIVDSKNATMYIKKLRSSTNDYEEQYTNNTKEHMNTMEDILKTDHSQTQKPKIGAKFAEINVLSPVTNNKGLPLGSLSSTKKSNQNQSNSNYIFTDENRTVERETSAIKNLSKLTKNNFFKTRNITSNLKSSYTENKINEILRSKGYNNASISLTKDQINTTSKNYELHNILETKDTSHTSKTSNLKGLNPHITTSTFKETPDKWKKLDLGLANKLSVKAEIPPLLTEVGGKYDNLSSHAKKISHDILSKYNNSNGAGSKTIYKSNVFSPNSKENILLASGKTNLKYSNGQNVLTKDNLQKNIFFNNENSKFKLPSGDGLTQKNEFILKKIFKK